MLNNPQTPIENLIDNFFNLKKKCNVTVILKSWNNIVKSKLKLFS
jgi:hypothetical protein